MAKQGEMVALVTATGANTYFGKTARLVSSAKSVSHFQKAVLTIGDYLIYLSLGLAAILLLTMLVRGEPVLALFQFALILSWPPFPWPCRQCFRSPWPSAPSCWRARRRS